jgi:transcriptional regulator with XRE-family HTH domain
VAQTNREIALGLADAIRGYRVALGISQRDLAERSGISITSASRFEQTGAITLNNLISILRALGTVDRIKELIPAHQTPSPLELLNASKAKPASTSPTRARKRAPRTSS